MKQRIFLSYARDDKAAAGIIAQTVTSLGYEVWWDHQLLPAENFRVAIRERLDAADATIVIWTAASVESQWVIDEAERASQAGKLIPLILGELRPEDLPIGLNRQHLIFLESEESAASEVFKRMIVEALTVPSERRRGSNERRGERATPIVIFFRAVALASKAYLYSLLFVRTAMNMLTQDYNYFVWRTVVAA